MRKPKAKKNVLAFIVLFLLISAGIFFSFRLSGDVSTIQGTIVGLPEFSDDEDLVVFAKVIQPETDEILDISEIGADTFELQVDPGLVLLYVLVGQSDFESAYFGFSDVVNIKEGKTQRLEISVDETEPSASLENNKVLGTTSDFLKSVFSEPSNTAQAAEERIPITVKISGSDDGWNKVHKMSVETPLIKDSKYGVIETSPEYLALRAERIEWQKQGYFDPESFVDYSKAIQPKFVVQGDIIRTKRPLYPSLDLSRGAIINIKIELEIVDAETGQVVATVSDSADDVNRVEFIWKVTKRLMAEPGAPGSTAAGPLPDPNVKKEVPPELEEIEKQNEAALTCNIPGFTSCADTFSLQGCVNTCAADDQACVDSCFAQADAHLDSCLRSSDCTKQEVIDAGAGAQR